MRAICRAEICDDTRCCQLARKVLCARVVETGTMKRSAHNSHTIELVNSKTINFLLFKDLFPPRHTPYLEIFSLLHFISPMRHFFPTSSSSFSHSSFFVLFYFHVIFKSHRMSSLSSSSDHHSFYLRHARCPPRVTCYPSHCSDTLQYS